MTRHLVNEISEKNLIYHRSEYPMRIGDVVKPKKNEMGKHWLESKQAEVALEVFRKEEFPEKPSRINCVYGSLIPRSRFIDKGRLYAIRPRGKLHIADSGLIDMINDQFDRDMFGTSGGMYDYWRDRIKDNPESAVHLLNYNLAQQYWEGKSYRGTFKTLKKDVEILCDYGEVVEAIEENNNDLRIGEIYEVTEDNVLFAWLKHHNEKNPTAVAFHETVKQHLFSKITEEHVAFAPGDVKGYFRKGLHIKPVALRRTVTKSSEEIYTGDSQKGKYSKIEIAFEMGGKWYEPSYSNPEYSFSLTMYEFLRHYHKQPFDFGKYLRKV